MTTAGREAASIREEERSGSAAEIRQKLGASAHGNQEWSRRRPRDSLRLRLRRRRRCPQSRRRWEELGGERSEQRSPAAAAAGVSFLLWSRSAKETRLSDSVSHASSRTKTFTGSRATSLLYSQTKNNGWQAGRRRKAGGKLMIYIYIYCYHLARSFSWRYLLEEYLSLLSGT